VTTAAPPVPKTSAELAEILADDARRREIFSSPENVQTFMDGYAEARQGEGTDLQRQVAEETQRQIAAYLREKELDPDNADRVKRLNLDPQDRARKGKAGVLTSYGQGANYNAKAMGAGVDGIFDTAEEFFMAAWHLGGDQKAKGKLAELHNAASSVSFADGGALVPEAFRSRLLEVAVEMGLVRSRATVVPMEAARVQFPAIDVSSHASSLYGGMIAYWGEESAALTDAAPKFGRIDLDARYLTGLSVVPNQLLQDSPISFSALIERLWPKVLAFEEDYAFIAGSGDDQPLGFLGAGNPAAVTQGKESGQTTSQILFENVIGMYSRLFPASIGNAVWLCAPNALPELWSMAVSVGTGGAPVMMPSVVPGPPFTLMGLPVIPSEKVPALGNRGCLALVDLSYYLVGDRQMMTAASSTEWKFGQNQTAYRLIQRVDGRPWIQSAITPRNGGPALSPFVEFDPTA
jgi:HK97 family phage major capsid protein